MRTLTSSARGTRNATETRPGVGKSRNEMALDAERDICERWEQLESNVLAPLMYVNFRTAL